MHVPVLAGKLYGFVVQTTGFGWNVRLDDSRRLQQSGDGHRRGFPASDALNLGGPASDLRIRYRPYRLSRNGQENRGQHVHIMTQPEPMWGHRLVVR